MIQDNLIGRFCALAVAQPDALAVAAPDARLTYGELYRRATALAVRLRESGIQRGAVVAVCLPRSASAVVSTLAVCLAGAAALALDPDQPDERLRFTLADSGSALLITRPHLAARLDRSDWIPPQADPLDTVPDLNGVGGRDAAYAVYTSGSTGTPKGVLVEHAGLARLVDWHQRAFALAPGDRSTLLASPGFDAAVWELWPALTAGASLHVPADDLKTDPLRLRDWLVAERISVAFAPTPLAESLLGLAWPDCALRYLLTGGDVLHRMPAPGLPFQLVNNYGLSEATVVSTSGVVAPGAPETVPSIGRPIDGVTLRIVDDRCAPVPTGVEGELLICGDSVARGYLGQPGLTATRFVADPLGSSARVYRTGDRVRLTEAGELAFAGRRDSQVQIRGLRVELGEISGLLASLSGVTESAVVTISDEIDVQLVAVVSPIGLDLAALREQLARRLPSAMVPSHLLELARLPLTTTGKIDRRALTDLAAEQLQTAPTDTADLVAPRNDVEATLAEVVAEKLKLPAVGVDQNFFLLGGHSMLGAQLIVTIAELYGVEMSLLTLFESPTVAQLAAEVERQLIIQIEAMSEDAVATAADVYGKSETA